MTVRAARAGAVLLAALTLAGIAGGILLRQAFPEARGSVDGLALLPMLIGLWAVGALITLRRPDNSYGWVLSGIALAWVVNGITIDYAALAAARGLPGVDAAAVVAVATGGAAWGTFVTFALLLYPTGGLPSRRWRWVGRIAGGGVVLMTIGLSWSAVSTGGESILQQFASGAPVEEEGAAAVLNAIGHLGVFFGLLAGAASLFIRRRGADAIQRLQLKWFAFGGFLVAVSILLAPLLGDFMWLELVALTAMPAVIGIAILRWRLYDIDRIVSRTLAYAVLTLLLVGIYLAAVTTLTALTAPVTRDSPLAVAAATLLAAAAFQPARRKIQSVVDRRFNRARYDARRTVEDFAAALRQEVDLDDVHGHLVETVDAVLQPAEVRVWLRPRSAS